MKRKERVEDVYFNKLATNVSHELRGEHDLVTADNADIDETGGIESRDGILKLADHRWFTGDPKADITFGWVHDDVDGTDYVMVCVDEASPSLWYIQTRTTTPETDWTEIKQVGATAWTANGFSAVSWQDQTLTGGIENTPGGNVDTKTILCNGRTGDAVQYWVPTTSAGTTLITGSLTYKADYMMVLAKRLLLGSVHDGTYDLANYFAISKPNQPHDFDIETTGQSGDLGRLNFPITHREV
jgi:hypothetical protein